MRKLIAQKDFRDSEQKAQSKIKIVEILMLF